MSAAMKARRPEPSEIEFKDMKFLIMDRPTDATLDKFIEELMQRNAHVVVRVCAPTYDTKQLDERGIKVLDWQFDDGSPPPAEVVEDWLNLVKTRLKDDPGSCIAVHCVAGLGRAPVLVALALIESGMKYEDAVALIREKRRGAINAKQLSYLEHYRPKSRLKQKGNRNGHHTQCAIL